MSYLLSFESGGQDILCFIMWSTGDHYLAYIRFTQKSMWWMLIYILDFDINLSLLKDYLCIRADQHTMTD